MPVTIDTQQVFNRAFCMRVRELREARGWTQEEMAGHLGIPAERYRKYEALTPKPRPMPLYLVPRFASLVGRDIAAVLTGRPEARRRPGSESNPGPRAAKRGRR